MALIPQTGSMSNYRTVNQIVGLSNAEQKELKTCMNTVCIAHLNPRKLWREQSDDAKAALKREATKRCQLLLRYADQWPIVTLASHILCNARAKLKRRRASARLEEDWAYVMRRKRPGRPGRASQEASASAMNQLEDAGDVESEDETIRVSSEAEDVPGQRSPSVEVVSTAGRQPSARRSAPRPRRVVQRHEPDDLMYPEDRNANNDIEQNHLVGAENDHSELPPVDSAKPETIDNHSGFAQRSASAHTDTLKRQRNILSPSDGRSMSTKRVCDGTSRAGPSMSRASIAQDQAGPIGMRRSTPATCRDVAQHKERGQPTPAGPPPSSGPAQNREDPSSARAGPSDRPASPPPIVARVATDPSASRLSEIHAFLHNISPSLATSDAVQRFAAAGVVTREDLRVFALLSKQGQLEMLLHDVRLSVMQAKLVREALGKM
ncbi:hypothetical protein PsYK624_158140 [Phanerochaete sordida]|uniref:Uncharacterized protein n=1 Tax=Phanerochaete sordida TaxID=48140 RepID=A0A9P3GQA2_9APHY|nr:hypothetical protein PsYK624_158140 [Phanerochaete sordida]